MRRAVVVLGLIGLILGSCAGSPATPTATQPTVTSGATAPPDSTPTPSSEPTVLPTTIATATVTSLPALPDLSGDLTWFAPLPPISTGPGRRFIGSDDFMELFLDEADWDVAASHIQVFKLYGEWVAYGATDDELATAVRAIRERGMALGVEAGPLDADEGCGRGIEGFAGTEEGNLIAERIMRAGGAIDFVALDEPYYYGAIYDGPNACNWPASKVAAEVGQYIELMRGHFPDIRVGDTEPTPLPVETATFTLWLEAFREVNGYDLAFLHLDMDWSRQDWPLMVGEIVDFGGEFGVPTGMIYIGNSFDPSDEVNISVIGERALRLEDEFGVDPEHILFQSWVDRPDRVLPESEPYTFTWLIRTYFDDRDSLGFRSEGAGANVAFGKEAGASRVEPGNEPGLAFDRDTGTLWSAGDFAEQWIEVDLAGVFDIASIRLVVSQFPVGKTTHQILGSGPDTGGLVELGILEGNTSDGDLLELVADSPWPGLETIRVRTISSPSWVAWREIEVTAAG